MDEETPALVQEIDTKVAESVQMFHVKGDLFTSTESLAHCVGEDFSMEDGISNIFKERYGRIDQLVAKNGQVGETIFFYNAKERRYIYYMITKHVYVSVTTYASLRRALSTLRRCLELHHVKKLSIPRLCCNRRDGLAWETPHGEHDVKSLIEDVFHGSDIVISVYTLD